MFLGPHKMKMSHYLISLWYPLELGTFLISDGNLKKVPIRGEGGVVEKSNKLGLNWAKLRTN